MFFRVKKIRKSKLPADVIHFQIERVNRSMINNNETFDATSKLESLISNGASISGHGREKQVGGKANKNRKRKSARPRFLSV